MDTWDRFQSQSKFQECITPRNFLLFIIIREYLGSFDLDNQSIRGDESFSGVPDSFKTEQDKFTFYKFLLDILNDETVNPFEILEKTDNPLKTLMTYLVRSKIQSFKQMSEVFFYISPSDLRENIFPQADNADGTEEITISRRSVFGLFMRKFVYGFQFLSYEQVMDLIDRFYECYSKEPITSKFYTLAEFEWKERLKNEMGVAGFLDADLECEAVHDELTRHQIVQFAIRSARQLSVNSCLDGTTPAQFIAKLNRYKSRFPDIAALHYVSYMLSVRKRNWLEAERDLHQYFAARALSHASVDADCTYAALNAASMHHTFGHTDEALYLEQEALEKALESESKVALDHVKALHSVLESSSAPFKYEAKSDTAPFEDVALTELRTDIRKMLNRGQSPKLIIERIFDSDVPLCSDVLPLCTLEVASLWATYGFKLISIAMAQCSVVFDCLKKPGESDEHILYAVVMLAKSYADAGEPSAGVDLLRWCESVYQSFPEKGVLRCAHLELEFDQRIREGDWGEATTLINGIRLYSAAEADIRSGQLHKEQGSLYESQEILQSIIDQPIKDLNKSNDRESAIKSADLEMRARFLLMDVLLDAGIIHLTSPHLDRLSQLVDRYHLRFQRYLIGVYRSALLLVKGEWLRALNTLRPVLVGVFSQSERFLTSRVRLLQAKCVLKAAQNGNSLDEVQQTENLNLSSLLEGLFEVFTELKSWRYQMDTAILLSSVYNLLGARQERNSWAQRFRDLHDIRYQSGEKHKLSVF